MSLNAIHRSVMIFGSTQERANEKIDELVNESGEEVIKRIMTRDYSFIQTINKTYQAKSFSESCRGYRYQKVYIDHEIISNNPESKNLIIAKLVPPKYYGLPQDENYNWREHIHFY